MIRKWDFHRIEIEVKTSLKEAFDSASENKEYLLFLSRAECLTEQSDQNLNQFVIDYSLHSYQDHHRREFLLDYINSLYSFNHANSVDSQSSIAIELMIYTHIWESKPFLRQLKRLSDLCVNKKYEWVQNVPDYPKHPFIKKTRLNFERKQLQISNVISKSFNSFLRNAFAHSEYYFDLNFPQINFTNFKGKKDYELNNISFDDWTTRFCYSFLLSHYFQKIFHERRTELKDGKLDYFITTKDSEGNERVAELVYDKNMNRFSLFEHNGALM